MTSKPSEDSFTPRKEFIRHPSHSPSSFSLLCFSASSLIRLYSFPPSVVSSLRRYLDERSLTVVCREDVSKNYYEFTVRGKPWSSPKSVTTERLLVNVLALIFQGGHKLLSPLDYGREPDDRIALAFSRPRQPSNSAGTASSYSNIPSSPTRLAAQHSTSTLPLNYVVPFAVSFTSATTVHVISPPLHSTPAILGAVRHAWPRGVVSEKKIGDTCYEFKFKGYRWFQTDTFATDSLQHIHALLHTLDSHSFTLLTSLSLSDRSRVKDLWIFTGLSDEPHQDLMSPVDPDTGLPSPSSNISEPRSPIALPFVKRIPLASGPEPWSNHKKPDTESLPEPRAVTGPRPPFRGRHVRAATEGQITPPQSHDVAHLQKPAPRAQIPVSITDPLSTSRRHNEKTRAILPSAVGSSINMTGVGAGPAATLASTKPDVQFSPYPPPVVEQRPPPLVEQPLKDKHVLAAEEAPPRQEYSDVVAPIPVLIVTDENSLLSQRETKPHLRHNISMYYTPPELPQQSDSEDSSSKHWTPPIDQPRTPSPPPASPTPPPFVQIDNVTPTSSTLLGPSAFRNVGLDSEGFRDSAFTTGGEWKNFETPIKCTETETVPEVKKNQYSLPGAWAFSPVEEDEEDVFEGSPNGDRMSRPDKQEAAVQMNSSELSPVVQIGEDRKSEAGLLGMMTSEKGLVIEKEKHNKLKRASDAWVMVNIEGRDPPVAQARAGQAPEGLPIHSTIREDDHLKEETTTNANNPPQAPNGTAAKTEVVIDDGANGEGNLPQAAGTQVQHLLPISGKENGHKPKEKSRPRKRWFGFTTKE